MGLRIPDNGHGQQDHPRRQQHLEQHPHLQSRTGHVIDGRQGLRNHEGTRRQLRARHLRGSHWLLVRRSVPMVSLVMIIYDNESAMLIVLINALMSYLQPHVINNPTCSLSRSRPANHPPVRPLAPTYPLIHSLPSSSSPSSSSPTDINKFLWMVRIGGSTDRGAHIKENDYYTPQGEFRVDKEGSPVLLNCLMYKMCYYRFGSVYTESGWCEDHQLFKVIIVIVSTIIIIIIIISTITISS